MPNKIKPKRSYTANSVPLTTDLETHELAINWVDNKAFTKNAAGQIVSVTLGGGGGGSEDPRWDYFKPAAPTSVTATATNAQAVVSWTAPAVAVPPVTDYVVQYSTNSGSTWTTFTDAVSTATSATITGLTNGSAHVFRVAAVNGIGTGAYSTASAAVTPTAGDPLFSNVALLLRMDGAGSTFVDSSASPKAITSVGAATQSSAQSKWGGKSLALNGSDANLSLPSTGFTLAGDFVIEGWLYLNSVSTYASIAETRSSPSYSDFICGVYNVGGLLRADFVTAGGGGARLTGSSTAVPLNSWAHIAFVRSAGVLSVYVNGTRDATQINYSSTITPQSSTMLIGRNVDGDFVNGFIDEFRITVGNNRSYTGATITVPTAAFPDGAMFAPTSLTTTGGNAQVSLAWTAPSYNGGSAITDYSVQYSSNSGSTWTTFSRAASTTASQVVTGLTNGTAYVFRVAGINANGTGTYTEASNSVTPVAMATVTGGTVTTPGDGYRYHTFTTSGTLAISSSALTADVLVVGAGGSGGQNFGGGGGGGGVLYQTNQSIAVGSYEVTVATTTARNNSGGASSIGSLYSASGGLAGVGLNGNYGATAGGSSGLPTSSSNVTRNAGGAGVEDYDNGGGGQGGGAGGVGVTGVPGQQRDSANGRTVFDVEYGRGGRGGLNSAAGHGNIAYNGGNNTGNGGSGGGDAFSNNGVGTGGSGVVIIRYLIA
jgi:titin